MTTVPTLMSIFCLRLISIVKFITTIDKKNGILINKIYTFAFFIGKKSEVEISHSIILK